MRRIVGRRVVLLGMAALAALAVGAAAEAAARLPILAGPWSSGQKGYGHVKPRTIFNGGDPTGLVEHIHWYSWGARHAVGTGTALWVGRNQIVAQGRFERGARVVLFRLGRCRGRRAYDAIEWYFPQHGQRFRPGTFIDSCTGAYYMDGEPLP